MDYYITNNGELLHYGIKGQKWGIRRYQNKDGSLTPEGKKRAKQEYKADNKMAYELGKKATISGHAAAQSMNRTIKLEKKLDKRLMDEKFGAATRRLASKWTASAKATEQLTADYMKNKSKAEEHYRSLVDKYGKEAVSEIKYTDVKLRKGEHSPERFKTINERTNNMSDVALAGAMTIGSSAFAGLIGAPVSILYIPSTAREKASNVESAAYYTNLQEQRRAAKEAANYSKQNSTNKAASTNKSTFDGNSRVTGQEESDFWKAYAEELEKQRRSG